VGSAARRVKDAVPPDGPAGRGAASGLSPANRDVVDVLLYPWYASLARHIPRTVTPNQITTWSGACGIAACACVLLVEGRLGLLLGALLLYLYTALDSLDGIHARATGQSSAFGYFYDHVLDSLVLVLLLFSVGVRFSMLTPFFVLLFLLRVMLNAVGFLATKVTGELHLPAMGPVFETICYAVAFLTLGLWPHSFVLPLPDGAAPWVRGLLARNGLLEWDVLRAFCLLYFVGIPLGLRRMLMEVRSAAAGGRGR
jgi:phosphatidylglycerophosphate synthase